jgi:glutamyl-tRNA synthetase
MVCIYPFSDFLVPMVRVRFAPSPTGYLHIGSLRTALYNFLFARQHGGVCILRVEDTDRTRFVEGAIEDQIRCLQWAGVEFDEGPHKGGNVGPYTQSERFHLYTQHAAILLENGTAYYAFDTSEELDAMRERQKNAGVAPKYDRSSMRNQYTLGAAETQRLLESDAARVVRLKVPIGTDVRFHDSIRGEMIINGREIDDQVLLKSDGFPTYHLANVVDDHLMEITHVIRAEEWLPSTPKHILLYHAFGWQAPTFAHVPLLLNADRTKMSKRHGDVMVGDFIAKGYAKEALVNYVALCGWNPGTDRELFTLEELQQEFSLDRVSKSGAIFDYKKLDWMNGEYLKSTPSNLLAEQLLPMLAQQHYTHIEAEYVANVIELLRERVHVLADIVSFGDYLFMEDLPAMKAEQRTTLLSNEALMQALTTLSTTCREQCLESEDSFKQWIKQALGTSTLKMGELMKGLRVVISHRDVGADMYKTILLLGFKRCSGRLASFVAQ